MVNRAHWRRLAALVMPAALLLAACGSSGGDDTATPDNTSAASDADPNGVLHLGYDLAQSGLEWDFNPLRFASGSASANDGLWFLPYGRLMRPTTDGAIEPDLATSVEIVDSTTITVELRSGLMFSDGSPLDAAAVKRSYETVLAAEADNVNGLQPAFFTLDAIDVTGPTSLTFELPGGNAASWFDQYVPTFASSIFKFDGAAPNAPIGAGAFTIAEYKSGQSMSLKRNPNYWNAEAVKLAGIEIQSVPFSQAASGLAALQSGQLDVSFSEPSLLASVTGDLAPIEHVSPNSTVNMHLCKADGPLADARVRQAINKGMNREEISDVVFYGTAQPATESWPEGHRLYNPDVGDVLAFDPEGARQLLADAGYGNGVTIDIYPIPAFNLDEAAEVIQQQLGKVGITLNIVPTPDYVNQFLLANKPGIGLYPSSVGGAQKANAWSGDSMANACDYSNPEITRLANDLTGVSEQSDEGVEIWHRLDELVTEEAPSGFVVFRADVGAYNADTVGDMAIWPTGTWIVPDPWVTYIKS